MSDITVDLEAVRKGYELDALRNLFPDGAGSVLMDAFVAQIRHGLNGRVKAPGRVEIMPMIEASEEGPKKKLSKQRPGRTSDDSWSGERWRKEIGQLALSQPTFKVSTLRTIYEKESGQDLSASRAYGMLQQLKKRSFLKMSKDGVYSLTAAGRKHFTNELGLAPEKAGSPPKATAVARGATSYGLVSPLKEEVAAYAKAHGNKVNPVEFRAHWLKEHGSELRPTKLQSFLHRNKELYAKSGDREWRYLFANEKSKPKEKLEAKAKPERTRPSTPGSIAEYLMAYAHRHNGLLRTADLRRDFEKERGRKISNSTVSAIVKNEAIFETLAVGQYRLRQQAPPAEPTTAQASA